MSAARSSKSHATAWTLSILAVPVLYMLSCPPFRILVVEHSEYPFPSWAWQVLSPYDWVRANTPLHRSLVDYEEFWMWLTGCYYQERSREDGGIEV